MSIEYWIAIGISVLSLIVLGVGAAMFMKTIKHTRNNAQEFQAEAQRELNRYSSEATHITERITTLSDRATGIAEQAQAKTAVFTDLSESSSELGQTLTMISENRNDLAKDALKASGKQVKEKGPQLLKLFGTTMKKTVRKQKERYTR